MNTNFNSEARKPGSRVEEHNARIKRKRQRLRGLLGLGYFLPRNLIPLVEVNFTDLDRGRFDYTQQFNIFHPWESWQRLRPAMRGFEIKRVRLVWVWHSLKDWRWFKFCRKVEHQAAKERSGT
jgi:hypothetical protein